MQINSVDVIMELNKMHTDCMDKLIESAHKNDDQQYQYNMGYSEAILHLLEFIQKLYNAS